MTTSRGGWGEPQHDVATFTPRGVFKNRHVQTFLAGLPPRSGPSVPRIAIRVPLPSRESLHGEATFVDDRKRPTALLIHGLGGSTQSAYVRRAVRDITRAGYHTVAVDLRGSGASDGTRHLYHAGLTEDVACALTAISGDPRVERVLLVGFSLGGHVSLKLAAEWGSEFPANVSGVVAIGAPIDLEGTVRAVERLRSFGYHRYVLAGLKANALRLKARLPDAVPLSAKALRGLTRVWDFDDLVIAPMHGFRNASRYYEGAGVGPLLPQIRLPAWVLAAADDPMVAEHTVRPWLARAPNVRAIWTPLGGHVAYVERVERGELRSFSSSFIVARLGA